MSSLRYFLCQSSSDEESSSEKESIHTPLLLEHQPCPEPRYFRPTSDGWHLIRFSHIHPLPYFPGHCSVPPLSFYRLYAKSAVFDFAAQNVQQWYGKVSVALSCGPGLPSVPVDAYGFQTQGPTLKNQIHHKVEGRVLTKALLFGFKDPRDSNAFRRPSMDWIDRVTNSDMFCKRYFEAADSLAIYLFKSALGLRAETAESTQLLRYTRHLVTVTYILARTISIDNVDNDPIEGIQSSRLLSRQAKSVLVPLQETILTCVLQTLERVSFSRNSKDCAVAFFCVILICMAFEDQQKTLLVVLDNHRDEMTEDCLQGPKNEFLADWKRVDELAGSVIQFFLQSQKGAPLKSLERFAYLVEENCT
ncbi:hypothetical protein DPSP01_013380 [Paraphaeosphaeria sporulosa]